MVKKGRKRDRLVECPVEQHYLGEHRKEMKEDRKRKQASDRSKYKKSDLEKHQKAHIGEGKSEDLKQGVVITISIDGFYIDCEGQYFICSLKGSLKQEEHEDKNLVTVGDQALFSPTGQGQGVIYSILPRKSELVRQDNITRKKRQLIASNVDQVFITVSVVSPLLRPQVIDRYIISALKGNMEPIIVINKIDLLEENSEQYELFEEVKRAYKIAAVPLIVASAKTRDHIGDIQERMRGKISLFAGQSGVGKSSLINAVTEGSLPVGEVVEATLKGSHTTTQARLIPLPFKGFCIDTPGIKSFGIWDLKKGEVASYFHEIDQAGKSCRFNNCTHTHEADCQVKAEVERQAISPIRYLSYLSLLEELDTTYKRR